MKNLVELPVQTDLSLVFITGLLPIIIGLGISFVLYEKYSPQHTIKIMLPLLIGSAIVFSSMAYFTGESNEYKAQLINIIESSDCTELLEIAQKVNSYYKELVVDEVILRCLSEQDKSDPVLMLLLSEVREG